MARGIEDKLSDALHQRLIERFVDRRTSALVRRLRENAMLETEITKTGEVVVEGHAIGRLAGFQFAADPAAAGPEAKALRAAAQKALAGEIDNRAHRLQSAADDQFVLASDGAIRWTGEPVAKLIAGEDVLHPRVRLIADERLTGASRDAVQSRLELWLKVHVEKLLGPLFGLAGAEDVTGIARGVAFQLVESLGVLERHKIADEVQTTLDRVESKQHPHYHEITGRKTDWLKRTTSLRPNFLAFLTPRRRMDSVLDFYLSKESEYLRQARANIARDGGTVEDLR